jgi:hypothetical protein
MEHWNTGMVEYWERPKKNGRTERWNNGTSEEWKSGRMGRIENA